MKMTTTNLVFRAFADQTRLRILNLLLDGEMCVCDLREVLDIPDGRCVFAIESDGVTMERATQFPV